MMVHYSYLRMSTIKMIKNKEMKKRTLSFFLGVQVSTDITEKV